MQHNTLKDEPTNPPTNPPTRFSNQAPLKSRVFKGLGVAISFGANLTDDLPYAPLNGAFQHLEAIFGDPNHMIAVVKNGMFAFFILHDLGVPEIEGYRPMPPSISGTPRSHSFASR